MEDFYKSTPRKPCLRIDKSWALSRSLTTSQTQRIPTLHESMGKINITARELYGDLQKILI